MPYFRFNLDYWQETFRTVIIVSPFSPRMHLYVSFAAYLECSVSRSVILLRSTVAVIGVRFSKLGP